MARRVRELRQVNFDLTADALRSPPMPQHWDVEWSSLATHSPGTMPAATGGEGPDGGLPLTKGQVDRGASRKLEYAFDQRNDVVAPPTKFTACAPR